MVGKARPLECEVPGHMASAVRKQVDAGAQLIFLWGSPVCVSDLGTAL